jgi:hypothetical protein
MNFAQFLTQEAAPGGSPKIPAVPGSLPTPANRGKEGKPANASSSLASPTAPTGAGLPNSHVAVTGTPGTPAPALEWQQPVPLAALTMHIGNNGAQGKSPKGEDARPAPAEVVAADSRASGAGVPNTGEKDSGIGVSAALSVPLPKNSPPPGPAGPGGPPERGAKIAAATPQASAPGNSGENNSEKKSLDSDSQRDRNYAPDVGIGSAQAMPAMATSTANHTLPTAGADLPGTVSTQAVSTQTVESGRLASSTSLPADASVNVRAANAVETVVSLVDAQASRAQGAASAVKINFNFNGDDLAVRIQVSNGSVHTQFRTDSPELRDAIATQWQSSTPAGREMNFLQPSFSSANGSPDAALTPDGGNASRRQDSPEFEAQTPSWGSSDLDSDSSSEPAAAPTPATLSTTRHLHTFA